MGGFRTIVDIFVSVAGLNSAEDLQRAMYIILCRKDILKVYHKYKGIKKFLVLQ